MRPFEANRVRKLEERALSGEKIKAPGSNALWVDFPSGVGKSKLTPVLFNQAAGSAVMMQNWNTVLKIDEILRG